VTPPDFLCVTRRILRTYTEFHRGNTEFHRGNTEFHRGNTEFHRELQRRIK